MRDRLFFTLKRINLFWNSIKFSARYNPHEQILCKTNNLNKVKRNQKQVGFEVKTFPVPYALGEIKENITVTIQTPSKPSKEQIINQAIKLHLKGNISEATKHYQRCIKQGFNDHRVFSNFGLILKGLGRLKEAERSTRKAIELKPDFAMAHYYLGIILDDLGRLKESEISFKKAIKLKFGFVQAYDALSAVQEKLGLKKEAEESSKKMLYLTTFKDSKSEEKRKDKNNTFTNPSPIEHPIFHRPGMGTENVGSFLRSMAMMVRPKRVLEIGAGYTTPFLLEALINNERVFDDGNLSESYFQSYIYEAKLVVIDNQSLGELTKVSGMKDIVNSNYTEFIEGNFEGKAKELYEKHGHFDFVWFDCGGPSEYISFIKEFWEYCSNYIFFHFTYWDGKPNINHKIIHENIKGNPVIIDIVEPHKKRQGSITMVKKENFKA